MPRMLLTGKYRALALLECSPFTLSLLSILDGLTCRRYVASLTIDYLRPCPQRFGYPQSRPRGSLIGKYCLTRHCSAQALSIHTLSLVDTLVSHAAVLATRSMHALSLVDALVFQQSSPLTRYTLSLNSPIQSPSFVLACEE